MNTPPAGIFTDLLDAAKLGEREAAERVAKAMDPGYWQRIAGHVRAGSEPHNPPLNTGHILAAAEAFRREGAYRVDHAVSGTTVDRLNRTIDVVLDEGWPGVFAFACDALWECARLESVRALVEACLGRGARQIPHIWTHTVKAGGGSAGWSPHVDGPGADRMTVWLALSNAGLDNGCMYVVPRTGSVDAAVAQWQEHRSMDEMHVKALLQGTRPMPAMAGDLLGWAFDVVHWGGRVEVGAPGRRSISLEFIAAGAATDPTDEPLVLLDGELPPHRERLRAIAAALVEYRKFEPLAMRYAEVAERLLHQLA